MLEKFVIGSIFDILFYYVNAGALEACVIILRCGLGVTALK